MNDFKKFSERKLSYNIASLILELNYEYTEKLYRLQNDYPLAPENLEIVIRLWQKKLQISIILHLVKSKSLYQIYLTKINKYLLCYQSLQLYLLKKSKKANKDFEKASLR